jgi:hypothetical protein
VPGRFFNGLLSLHGGGSVAGLATWSW